MNKYNWPALKREYIEGSIQEVGQFLISKGIKKPKKGSGNNTQTIGWRVERDLYWEKIGQKSHQKLLDNPEILEVTTNLIKTKYKILGLVQNGLKDFEELVEFDQGGTPIINRNMLGLKTAWEMIKIELNEPTTYIKSDNTNKNIDFKDFVNALKNADT
jgi:hypothetical protein